MNSGRSTSMLFSGSELPAACEFILGKKYSKIFVLTDSNTKKYCWPVFLKMFEFLQNSKSIVISPGESNKNFKSIESIIDVLVSENADKNSVLINLGGGVVCDVGGFAASIYKRGICFINVPTSLLAMVDASTGGKTGINFNHIKNTIGTFTEPDAVVIHEPFLKSLADVEMRSGFAEVLKHILLSDGERWKKLIEEQAISPREIINSDIILSSISFKKKITGEDFYDKGLRKILNFGHTIGHALEGVAASKSENLRHGEAVAAGMVAELFLSNKLSGFPYEEMNRSTKYIVSVFHDFNIPSSMNSIFDFLKTDKKNEGERIAFSLLKSPGQPAGIYFPDEETIKSSLDFMISEFSLTSVDDKNH